MKRLEIILGVIGALGILLMFFDLPGGSILMVLSLTILALLYVVFGFSIFNNIKLKNIFKKEAYVEVNPKYIIGGIGVGYTLAILLIGLIIKIWQWSVPADHLLSAGLIIALMISTVPTIFFRKNQTEYFNKIGWRIKIIGIICLIFYFIPRATLIDVSYRHHKEYAQAIKALLENPDDVRLQNKKEVEYMKAYIPKEDQAAYVQVNNLTVDTLLGYEIKIAHYAKEINFNSNNTEAYFRRAIIYKDMKEYKNSMADFSKVIKLDSNYTAAYFKRALICHDMEEYEKSIADYSKVIELDSSYESAFYNRGIAYRKIKNNEKALADYLKAIDLKPNDTNVYFSRANLYRDIKDYEKAVADYSQIIEVNPKNEIAFFQRAIIYFEMNNNKMALADFSQAIELKPKWKEAYYNRGTTYFIKMKNYQNAILDFTKAIELDPKYTVAYNGRGNAFHKLKNLIKACENWKIAAEMGDKEAEATVIKFCK